MNIQNLNMYERLRDFKVPAAVLDEIFSNEKDLKVLSNSWNDMEETGLKGDDIASRVAELILKELEIDPHKPVEK